MLSALKKSTVCFNQNNLVTRNYLLVTAKK